MNLCIVDVCAEMLMAFTLRCQALYSRCGLLLPRH